jgi:cytochrome c556
MIYGAETAERMGDFTASREFLNHLQSFEAEAEKFKDRVTALEAKLAAAQAQ